MPAFTISPLPASLVDQARSAAVADGTAVEVTSNDDAPFPVRCCLHDATAEEGVLLLSVQPRSADSPYAAPGPVYIHRDRCAAGARGARNCVPVRALRRPRMLRMSHRSGRMRSVWTGHYGVGTQHA